MKSEKTTKALKKHAYFLFSSRTKETCISVRREYSADMMAIKHSLMVSPPNKRTFTLLTSSWKNEDF